MSSTDVKEFRFTADTTQAEADAQNLRMSISELNMVINTSLSLLSRMGLGEDVDNAIMKLRSLLNLVNALIIANRALSLSSPVMMLLSGVGAAGALVSTAALVGNSADRRMRR